MARKFENNINIQSVYVLPILDKFLVYSPFHRLSALMNKSAAEKIKDYFADNSFENDISGVGSIIKELTKPANAQVEQKKGKINPDFLGIVGSRKCNMSCSYCNFGAKSNPKDTVNIDKVIKIIDYFANLKKEKGQKQFKIEFFGGEPFVEQEIIEIIVHHSKLIGAKTGVYPFFSALTNGYLTDKQRIFIKDYFDSIIISFDGFRKHHDRTRVINENESSYQKVFESLKYFSKTNIDLSIRCCITSESVLDMPEMTEWFCSEFNPDTVNFEILSENIETQKFGLKAPEPYSFAKNLIKSWKILKTHKVKSVYAPVSLNELNSTTCPVGNDIIILHPDGTLASCYLLEEEWKKRKLDLTLGRIDSENKVNIEMEKVNAIREMIKDKPRCTDCFCKYSCAGNCHVNTTFPGSESTYTDFCKQIRIITACTLLQNMDANDIADVLLDDDTAQVKLNSMISDKLPDLE